MRGPNMEKSTFRGLLIMCIFQKVIIRVLELTDYTVSCEYRAWPGYVEAKIDPIAR
jgi:hypothetical protein